MSETGNARYWAGVLYPENMADGWEDNIDDLLQIPYSYVIHNQDVDENGDHRKDHVDMILAFPNTTTYKHALATFNTLSAEGKKAINTCERIRNIRYRYNYQVHDTDSCRKANKHLYKESERHTGNNFDIGCYEQISTSEKEQMAEELADLIDQMGFRNFMDLRRFIRENMGSEYLEVLRNYCGYLEKLTHANYQLGAIEKWREIDESL